MCGARGGLTLCLLMTGPLTEPVRLVAMTHRSSLTALGGLPTVDIMSSVPLVAPQMLLSLVYITEFLLSSFALYGKSSFIQGFGGHLEADWPPVFLNCPRHPFASPGRTTTEM